MFILYSYPKYKNSFAFIFSRTKRICSFFLYTVLLINSQFSIIKMFPTQTCPGVPFTTSKIEHSENFDFGCDGDHFQVVVFFFESTALASFSHFHYHFRCHSYCLNHTYCWQFSINQWSCVLNSLCNSVLIFHFHRTVSFQNLFTVWTTLAMIDPLVNVNLLACYFHY